MAKWLSPVGSCNICKQEITSETFVDGKTVFGPWALMCESCHKKAGIGLGTGLGQRYNTKTKEKVGG